MKNGLTFTGVVKEKVDPFEIETKSGEMFKKATIILEETGNEYNDSLAVDFLKDNADHVANMKLGDIIKVYLGTKASSFMNEKKKTKSIFNNIRAWRFEKLDKEPETKAVSPAEDSEDLPF